MFFSKLGSIISSACFKSLIMNSFSLSIWLLYIPLNFPELPLDVKFSLCGMRAWQILTLKVLAFWSLQVRRAMDMSGFKITHELWSWTIYLSSVRKRYHNTRTVWDSFWLVESCKLWNYLIKISELLKCWLACLFALDSRFETQQCCSSDAKLLWVIALFDTMF